MKICYLIIILVLISFNVSTAQKTKKQLEVELEQKEQEINNKNEEIGALSKHIIELQKNLNGSGTTSSSKPTPSSPPIKTWKKEYDDERIITGKLRTENGNLKQKIELLEDSLAKEIRKVENLEFQKQQLETEMAAMKTMIGDLKVEKRILQDTLRKAELNVVQLERDTASLNKTIIGKDDEIFTLTGKNNELELRKAKLIEVVKRKNNDLDYARSVNLVDKLNLLSAYVGINYSLYNGSKTLQYESPWYSNYTLSFYNIVMGGGFFIQMPIHYQNLTSTLADIKNAPHYSIFDLETFKLELDRLGDPTYSYTNFNYIESQGDFKSYSYGLNISVLRNFYLMAGLTNIRGTSWDLYSGDLSAYGEKIGMSSEFPTKYNDMYIVNYEELSVNKAMLGVVGSFTLVKQGKEITVFGQKIDLLKSRESKTQTYVPALNKYNHRFGFQIEVGYNWFYEDVFVNVGLHTRLANYDKDLLFDQEESLISDNNVRRGISILREGFSFTNKADSIQLKIQKEQNAKKAKKMQKQSENLYKKGNQEIIRGLNILASELIRDSIYNQKESDILMISEDESKVEKAASLDALAKSMGKLSSCLMKTTVNSKENSDEEEIHTKRKKACQECMTEDAIEIIKEYSKTSLERNDAHAKTLYNYFGISIPNINSNQNPNIE